ncbi:MAG: helix-turn-helix domain-containing protein [Dysgonamonadaceae bacterium]|jgi:transcriptional regulator with XRE-family HTH domain|nr:helix-turn-helix domain-containing protein [Dysgonamonadaceae bacterium]
MSELQKNIIERLLKEQKKTKRDLAQRLGIKENSINRTLRNSNISIRKLEQIAEFLDIEVNELILKKHANMAEEHSEAYVVRVDDLQANKTIYNLSEVIKINSRTIEKMAETGEQQSKNIENLVKLISEKYLESNS